MENRNPVIEISRFFGGLIDDYLNNIESLVDQYKRILDALNAPSSFNCFLYDVLDHHYKDKEPSTQIDELLLKLLKNESIQYHLKLYCEHLLEYHDAEMDPQELKLCHAYAAALKSFNS